MNQDTVIRGFLGQILVRPIYMKYNQTSMIRTSIIRGPRLSTVFETTNTMWYAQEGEHRNILKSSLLKKQGTFYTLIRMVMGFLSG